MSNEVTTFLVLLDRAVARACPSSAEFSQLLSLTIDAGRAITSNADFVVH